MAVTVKIPPEGVRAAVGCAVERIAVCRTNYLFHRIKSVTKDFLYAIMTREEVIEMLHCTVCEDDKSSAEVLHGMTNEYPAKLDCYVFFNPIALLSAVRSGKRFDLYILDIIMPELSGVDLAREIRKADNNCVIVFLTSSDEFHRDAFGVEALQYLDKPVNKETLYHAFDRSLRYIGQKSDEILPLQTKMRIHALHIDKIVYVESFRHILTFHLSNGSAIETLDSSLSLEKLSEKLRFPSFCAPYLGFIINLSFVDCLRKLQLSMTTGAVIPIPQKQFSRVRQQYSDYLLTWYAKGEI